MKTALIFAGAAALLLGACKKELPQVPPQMPKTTTAAPAPAMNGDNKANAQPGAAR